MIEKLNIPLEDKQTKKVRYTLYLDIKWWSIEEFNSKGYMLFAINN